jgi:uncharacterized membrane protein
MFSKYYKILGSWLLVWTIILVSIPVFTDEAVAKSRTGGRAGGKSGFSRSSSSSSSSSPSRSRDYSSQDYSRNRDNTVYVPVPSGGGWGGWGGSYYPGYRYSTGGINVGSLILWTLIIGGIFFVGYIYLSRMNAKTSSGRLGMTSLSTPAAVHVVKFQLALLAAARELQMELNKLAETADTDDPAGLRQLLQEATLAFLRHPNYWMQAGFDVYKENSYEAGEARFDELVMAERAKFSEETLSNIEGRVQRREAKPDQSVQEINDYLVATLIVATTRTTFQPLTAMKTEELRKVLNTLGSLSDRELLAVEVLWTPQGVNDILTEDDLLVGYPELRQI